ncbi:HAMP domain-containing histidine kinase [Mesorhizobium sp. WSM4307]|uniref:HAMP domain-containing sensor histidine kinase n=1 Tax=unclassified Mesorhizobium TaxID=325217 RepID=UPI00115E2FC9|nr:MULTISPECIES: HAMP domain-containing sensor histidine kinase [unclassified Mesorhizobium]TRC76117.1 HAMP domain-containing histidine kinase [Mesorhizobium sp. WSM4315]TRC84128.1 HAMP domain-containing histidine kinase [Mesorhizobium sp. WSM4307]
MPRLFKKFFVITWLTLAGSVAIIIATLNFFETLPSASKLERQKREVVLDLTENLLVKDGEEAARRLAHASEDTVPVGLTISRIAETGACADRSTAETRTVLKDGSCYRISVPRQGNVILDKLGPFVPGFGILISSAISAAALVRYLIRPVVHLRDGLSALAHGRFDVRIGHKMAGRKDEVSALAHDFDSSAARLQELQDAQQRLFHDVSHELRSPLSRLQAVGGVLRQSPGKLDAMLDRMDREVERLDALVGEVLTLARLTAGSRLPLKTQTLDVIDLLNEILGDAAFEAQAREVSITANVDGSFLAEVEGELIYRALENVIRNAVKYTAEHSQVTVQCQTTGDLLKVRVADRGLGVGRGELERIFQPFSRGNDAAPGGGYGLGLAIARQAIEGHGGRVYASLPDVGGLAITLEIPRRPAMSSPAKDRG